MEPLAALAPAIAEIDILVDVSLIEVNHLVVVPLGGVQKRTQVFDECFPPLGVGSAEQLLGFLPGQLEPVQGSADGLAAAALPKPVPHEPGQAPQGPAWLRISPGYGWAGGMLLRGADGLAEGGGDVWAKGGRPPVCRYTSAAGPCSL